MIELQVEIIIGELHVKMKSILDQTRKMKSILDQTIKIFITILMLTSHYPVCILMNVLSMSSM